MVTGLRIALKLGTIIGVSASLAACDPDDMQLSEEDLSFFDGSGPLNWPLDEPYASGLDWPVLPAAIPMSADLDTGYRSRGYAPLYDYAPELRYYDHDDYYDDAGYHDAGYYDYDRYYDDVGYYDYGPVDPLYYDSSPGIDQYAWLALAALMGGVLADAPPDYYFAYDDLEPWVWVTGDRYVRFAEPLRTGYRYYYYAPGAARPFLVRDPYYSYGYRDDRLAVIYDSRGRILDERRALRLRDAASDYYDRAEQLYRASRSHQRHGVNAQRWAGKRAMIARDQIQWEKARERTRQWRGWERENKAKVESHWTSERAARRYASQRFDAWRDGRFKGPAPEFRGEAKRSPFVREALLARAGRAGGRDPDRARRDRGTRSEGRGALTLANWTQATSARTESHGLLAREREASGFRSQANRTPARSIQALARRDHAQSASIDRRGDRATARNLLQRNAQREAREKRASRGLQQSRSTWQAQARSQPKARQQQQRGNWSRHQSRLQSQAQARPQVQQQRGNWSRHQARVQNQAQARPQAQQQRGNWSRHQSRVQSQAQARPQAQQQRGNWSQPQAQQRVQFQRQATAQRQSNPNQGRAQFAGRSFDQGGDRGSGGGRGASRGHDRR